MNLLHKIDHLETEIRLDRYVSENLSLFSRSQIKARGLTAKINGKTAKLSRLVKYGDILELSWEDAPPVNIIAQDIPLEIIYEDENQLVINKAQGMVVHPGAGNRQNTLANAVYFRILQKNGKAAAPDCPAGQSLRPGIVHRLDKDTSGVIIAALNEEAHAFLARQFKERKTGKTYIAIVQGTPKEKKGRIENFIARNPKDRKSFSVSNKGKKAVTFFKVAKSWHNYSLVFMRPATGRTHQLRVHMRHIGHPILGDRIYGFKDNFFPEAELMLHSKSLKITLFGEAQPRVFSSKTPERFIELIKKLNKEKQCKTSLIL